VVRRLEQGVSIAEVARALEINPSGLHRWRRELREYGERASAGLGQKRAEQGRVAELERKVGRQAMEIDFEASLAACRQTAPAAGSQQRRALYAHIEEEVRTETRLPVSGMCDLAQVSRAGYYCRRAPAPARRKDVEIRDAMHRIALEWPAYGTRQMARAPGSASFCMAFTASGDSTRPWTTWRRTSSSADWRPQPQWGRRHEFFRHGQSIGPMGRTTPSPAAAACHLPLVGIEDGRQGAANSAAPLLIVRDELRPAIP
jgi:transposase-like protein